MIRIFYGDNRVMAQKVIKQQLGDYEIVEADKIQRDDMPSVFLGTSLFGEIRSILIKDLSENKECWELLPNFIEGCPHHIVIWETKLDKRSAVYKSLSKNKFVELKEFKMAEDPNKKLVFDIFDTAFRGDGKKAVQVAYNLNIASAKAIAKFRELGLDKDGGRIGTVLNLTPTYAASDSEDDQAAAHFAELWNNKMFLEPAIHGHFPEELEAVLEKDGVIWQTEPEDAEIFKHNTVDFLGVNFYHPNRVKAPDIAPNSVGAWLPSRYYDEYNMPGRRMNIDKGWEIYPEAIYDIAINIRDNYRNIPWFVSENGMGVSREERFMDESGQVQDDYRIDFIKEHLACLHRGIEEGSNCFGYHLWTPIDCWSWMNAYRNRYGFISNNIHTQVKTIKKSGEWFKQVTIDNGFKD